MFRNKYLNNLLAAINFLFIFLEVYVAHGEELDKLIEGAKKEKQLVFYSGLSQVTGDSLLKGFEKKYPFIKTSFYKSLSGRILTKVMLESSSGNHFADVITSPMYPYKKEKLLLKYIPLEGKKIPEAFKDDDDYWVGVKLNVYVISYNTKLVSQKEVPRSYLDLLEPKWKGRIGLEASSSNWFFEELNIMGKEKGIDFMKKLSKQEPQLRQGKTLVVQLNAAGEFALSVGGYAHVVEQFKAEGAPINCVPVEPLVTGVHGAGIYHKAPHSNAAKLFINFILSEEGQKLLGQRYNIPVRLDVKTETSWVLEGKKFHRENPETYAAHLNEYNQLFRSIFYKK